MGMRIEARIGISVVVVDQMTVCNIPIWEWERDRERRSTKVKKGYETFPGGEL